MEQKRIVYFDYLRVFSIIAVVFIHVSAQNWSNVSARSFDWNVFNFYDSIVRWGVPIFVMISGSLFLKKDIDIKTLYKKNILRLAVVFCVWSVFYGLLFVNRDYHLWFLPMIIGVYMCVPIIKEIVNKRNVAKYFLILSFVFAFVIPQLVNMSRDFVGGIFAGLINLANVTVTDMNMSLVLGYAFYFVLGHYLNEIELTKKQRVVIYVLGVIGFISTILLNSGVAFKTGEACNIYYGEFNVNVLLETVAVHTWFKYRKYGNEKLNAVVSKLSKYSFGVYLVHVFVIETLLSFGLHTMLFMPVVSVPVIAIITVIISFILSFLLNKIPKVNKWIV